MNQLAAVYKERLSLLRKPSVKILKRLSELKDRPAAIDKANTLLKDVEKKVSR
jgi:hypothetical protein